MAKMNYLRLMCFFTSMFHEIKILIIIDMVLAKKNDPVPKFKKLIK